MIHLSVCRKAVDVLPSEFPKLWVQQCFVRLVRHWIVCAAHS